MQRNRRRRPRRNQQARGPYGYPKGQNINQVNSATVQSATQPSKADFTVHRFKMRNFTNVTVSNANSTYSWGRSNFLINTTTSPIADILDSYGRIYEQYRISKITLHAQCGQGYNNSLRIKTQVAARVDVDQFIPDAATGANLQSVLQSQNCTIKTLTERGNVEMCTFRPRQRSNISNLSEALLPNNLEWFPIADRQLHRWKGMELAVIIPEPALAPNTVRMVFWADITLECRGRIIDPVAFSVNSSLFTPEQTEEETVRPLSRTRTTENSNTI